MLTNSTCKKTKPVTKRNPVFPYGHGNETRQCENRPIANIKGVETERKHYLAQFVNQLVATKFDVAPELLLQCNRGKAEAARARQISIYLIHTTLSFSFTDISKVYCKDRTTIAHACHVIEDLRDDENFDFKLNQLERTINTVILIVNGLQKTGIQND